MNSTNPQNRNTREFNVNRDHTPGQFLRAHPEANRVLKRLAVEAVGSFSVLERLSKESISNLLNNPAIRWGISA